MPRFRSLVLTLIAADARSQDHQVLGGSGEDPASLGSDLDHVLDANPAQPLEVDPRLDRDHRPFGQRTVATRPKPRRLVDLQADAVARSMSIPVAVAGFLDGITGGGIDLLAGHPRLDRIDPRLLRPAHHAVDLPEPAVGLAEGHGPGHVRVLAVHHAAVVHLYHVAARERAAGR